ncbi:glycosyltransferase family 4 protein [Alkalinema pantanalense CENA528]|uniref:glycosyltransferase family 4 protein n=1 Tax=Alkalinema pantanalense TaxID=1620705 RepID=UPI003D6ED562
MSKSNSQPLVSKILQTNLQPKVSQTKFPDFAASSPRSRQSIALISVHGDPAVEIGREEAGGQNVYVREVGEALAKLGWQVDMFTRKSHADQPKIVHHAPGCRTIRLTAGPEEFIARDNLFQYLPEFVEAFQKFQTKEGTNYPLIHTNYWMSAWVGLQLKQRSNIQLIHTYHSLGSVKYKTVEHKPPIAHTRLQVEQAILESGDCVVSTSPQELEHLRSLVSQDGYVEIIPCGTDIERFHRQSRNDARHQLGFTAEESIVLYVGRFDPRKGIETLVRAFAQLQTPDSTPKKLVIVGGSDPNNIDGQERCRIEQLTQELGIADCTVFAGQIGHDRLPLYYTAADVCAIPSHYEPFGLVAVEAMACGTPVVASDVGGLKFTVIPEETGLLVPPQDVEGFTAAIDRLLTDDLWTQKLRRQAAARVHQNFSWAGVGAQLSNLYRRMLAQSLSHPTLIKAS